MQQSIDLFPVVDPADDEAMMCGVPQKRYIVIPADYDASTGTYNEREQILATSDNVDEVKAFVLACGACAVFDIDAYMILDTETGDLIDE